MSSDLSITAVLKPVGRVASFTSRLSNPSSGRLEMSLWARKESFNISISFMDLSRLLEAVVPTDFRGDFLGFELSIYG